MSNKKKIGIVTITNDGYNFGNRLQNYALQSVLERMGFHVETLNRPIREDQRSMLYTAKIFARFFIPYHRTIGRIKAWNFFFWNRRYIKWRNFHGVKIHICFFSSHAQSSEWLMLRVLD